MTIIIILGVTAFLASIWGLWQVIKSVSEGSNFDEDLDKSIHNPCPYGNKDCPICNKKGK